MLERHSVLHARPLVSVDPRDPLKLSQVHPLRCLQWTQWPGSDEAILQQQAAALGLSVPVDGRRAAVNAAHRLLRIGPDRVLLLSVADGLPGTAAVPPPWIDVSHSRSLFRLGGPAARTVLAHGVPIDLRPDRFPPHAFAQTRLGHLDVLVLYADAQPVDCFEIMVQRSYALDLLDWLRQTMASIG